ncbi:PspC domain-containing protein [Gordonia iterans]|uniref:PspC domain-containing protein n=1 Tax=Gordonia iterans TaxID=1004901 RepID=A0A2S0KHS6_9ACTN|nr:PspC domain-containing protein [Gordonia iterans]AVM01247.1 PspC domain-containing protein [Gordonia iterans]
MTDPLIPPIPQPDPAPASAPGAASSSNKRLTRSSSDKMLGGVCGGLARYFGVDATWVRIAFVASILLPGPQVLLYLLLWLIIPKD